MTLKSLRYCGNELVYCTDPWWQNRMDLWWNDKWHEKTQPLITATHSVQIWPPKIPYALFWKWTQVSAVRYQHHTLCLTDNQQSTVIFLSFKQYRWKINSPESSQFNEMRSVVEKWPFHDKTPVAFLTQQTNIFKYDQHNRKQTATLSISVSDTHDWLTKTVKAWWTQLLWH